MFRKDKKLCLNNVQDFWAFIYTIQNEIKYMDLLQDNLSELLNYIHINEDELKITLLGKAVLQMASHFGFKIKLLSEDINDLVFILNNKNIPLTWWNVDKEKLVIDFRGIWSIEAVEYICEYFDYDELKCILIKNKGTAENKLRNILLHHSEYKDMYTLCDSDVYYSGVMPRVMRIECINQTHSSKGIKCIKFYVCRTTYATVDCMDNSTILTHPFFKHNIGNKTRLEVLAKVNYYEDCLQQEYLYNKKPVFSDNKRYEEMKIEDINNYLSKSINTHTVAVSGNIITKDNYLILSKRSTSAIDADKFYCSVNGQSEFRDENVKFYKTSVFEDMPSMDFQSKYRIDLNNELRREVIAELGIPLIDRDWIYYGISYLSINNEENHIQEKSSIYNKRRMHFNVLAYNTVPYMFSEIVKSQKKATEYFENQKLVGLRIYIFPNIFYVIFHEIRKLINWLIKNRSNFFLLYFFVTYLLSQKKNTTLQFRNVVDIIVFFTYVMSNILQWWKAREIIKLKINKYFILRKYIKNNQFDLKKVHEHLSSHWNKNKKLTNMHAIAKVMFSLFFIKINEKNKNLNCKI